jgi:hypothetical protein
MKKVLSVVLALVMMLSVVSMMAVAKQEADYTMTIGETKTVYLPGAVYDDFVIVKFTPAGSGKVVITSDGKSSLTCNPVLEVYKGELKSSNFIGKAENNGTYHNFKYELNCEPGVTYFLAMHNSLSATEWKVSIECLHETYVDGSCITCLGACPHEKADNIVGCCPCGEVFDGSDIKVGESVQLKSKTNRVWFRFTPDETAPYILKSENPEDKWLKQAADPNFIIVDETGNVVLANDANVGADNKNFNFPFLFKKGERYFIGVKDEKIGSDDWYFTILSGTSHTVEVEVEKEVEVENEDGTTSTETVIEKVTVEHELKYLPYADATCQAAGHTPAIVCEKCDIVIAGNDEIPQITECKDDNADNKCDWCGRKLVEDDPCTCNCHKSGITKFFWDIGNFFNKIFRLKGVCKCGERHW